MPDLTKVRTTIEPDREIEVGPAELLDLQRQGLLLPESEREGREQGPKDRARGAGNGVKMI